MRYISSWFLDLFTYLTPQKQKYGNSIIHNLRNNKLYKYNVSNPHKNKDWRPKNDRINGVWLLETTKKYYFTKCT